MRKYKVTLTGETPLIMHGHDIEWLDALSAFRTDPLNAKSGKAGDDRTPAWSWIGSLYHDGKVLGIPSDNLMTCLRNGAGFIKIAGKGNKTFKSQSQSGMMVDQILWPVIVNTHTIPWSKIEPLMTEAEFEKHKGTAHELGFELFIKPAKIGNAKHVRVRPRFETWSAAGTITVFDDMITTDVLKKILMMSGSYCGLCDWRPMSPKSPGQFGKFTAKVTLLS
jgi:hypothetical protein